MYLRSWVLGIKNVPQSKSTTAAPHCPNSLNIVTQPTHWIPFNRCPSTGKALEIMLGTTRYQPVICGVADSEWWQTLQSGSAGIDIRALVLAAAQTQPGASGALSK